MDHKSELLAARKRITPFIHNTPVISSSRINEIAQAKLFFKCENFQKMGAFKIRGASNAALKLDREKISAGLITHSSGNMAQAVSLAAKNLGVPAYIVMPNNAPQVKKDAVKSYGGQITEVEPTMEARESMTQSIIAETNAHFLHPSNDLDVIYGQGTAAMELLEEVPDIEAIIVPVGGGGLLAGTALVATLFGHNCLCYAGEPMGADDAYRSLQTGTIQKNKTVNTIADGLRTNLGDINFPIIKENVEEIIRVEESEIIAALRLVYERLKIVIEPSCAVPFAALLKSVQTFKGKKVGIIFSGGNVDLKLLSTLFS